MDLRTHTALPLGLRNNNPANLRDSGIQWKGRVGSNEGFVVFDSIETGVRAYGIDLRSKINRGLNTINKIIPVYAPPSENNTQRYISDMVKNTGYSANKILSPDGATMLNMAKSTFQVENGAVSTTYLSDRIIQDGLSRSGAFAFSSVGIPVLFLIIAIAIVLYFIK
jgi:hypothetical protein